MTIFRRWLLTTLCTVSLPFAQAQQITASSPDPARNFVGEWSGTTLINPTHLPSHVQLTISELPDGSGMRWDYIFGEKGQKGYVRSTKSIRLNVLDETMLMQWEGEDQNNYTTSGLEDFARIGYGKFTASHSYEKRFLFSKDHITSTITFQLGPSKMTYLWETTTNGKTEVYSQFSFDRLTSASAPAQSTPNH